MADKIRVNTGSLDHTKENVANQIRQIRSQISSMRSNVQAMNAMWEGEAHTTFNAHFLSDINKLEQLCGMLDGIVNYEGNAVTEYNRCEKEVGAIVDSIRV